MNRGRQTNMPVRELYIDKAHVRVFEDRDALGRCAGDDIAGTLRMLLQKQDQVNIMFAAAPSQNEVLTRLVAAPGIDWPRVIAWHMDEYIGLEAGHPASFVHFLHKALFDKLPFRSTNCLNGCCSDPSAEAARYGALLQGIHLDICVLGIGENGHIAFNDPGVADLTDPETVRIVCLDERCRRQQVNDGAFSCVNQVPETAITVTVTGLLAADRMFCCVPGRRKAEAVARALYDPISPACPASALRTKEKTEIYLDRDSAAGFL